MSSYHELIFPSFPNYAVGNIITPAKNPTSIITIIAHLGILKNISSTTSSNFGFIKSAVIRNNIPLTIPFDVNATNANNASIEEKIQKAILYLNP